MPGQHKGHPTISFRPSEWERAIIEERAALSGLHKKDFITRSCVYAHITVVGKKENVQRIVDELQEMQNVMKDIAEAIMSGDFSMSADMFEEMRLEYLALVITVVEIVNGAAYLFGKESVADRRNWKAELALEQYRHMRGWMEDGNN